MWSLQELDLDDEINAEIWSRSAALDEALRGQLTSTRSGLLQSRYQLPWVPDLVGRRWREAGGVHVVGSAYSPFIEGEAGRGHVMPLDDYQGPAEVTDFQRAFVRDVVAGDPNYYVPLGRLIEAAVGDCERLVLTDLVRGCFFSGGLSGDDAVHADPANFMAFARAGWPWTWRRLVESEATVIVTLGTIAENGLLQLLARQRLLRKAHVPGRPDVMPPFVGSPVTRPASRMTFADWRSGGRWWKVSGIVEGRPREWRILPIQHPARINQGDPGYRGSILALCMMIAGSDNPGEEPELENAPAT